MTLVVVTRDELTETRLQKYIEAFRKVDGVSEATVLRDEKSGVLI